MFDFADLAVVSRDLQDSVAILHELGNFTMGVDGNMIFPVGQYESRTIKFKLANPDNPLEFVYKPATIRSSSPIDSPEYRVYLGELTSDSPYKDATGKPLGLKGTRKFYAEGIGGTPRLTPASMLAQAPAPADTVVPPFGG